MQLFGIPTCPYCRKRVNYFRAWSLRKHGEYRCPRCKGISNIYLSPLTYVLAFIAIAAGFLIYFFGKFISDSIGIMTVLEVLAPFVIFFLLTPFMVYFKKPVIKRVRKTQDGRFFDEEGNEMVMRMGKLVPNGKKDPRYARKAPQQVQAAPAAPAPQKKEDFIDINTKAPVRSTAAPVQSPVKPAAQPPIQPIVYDTKPEDDSDMKLKIGRIAMERNSGTSAPNSGFEDLFEHKDEDFEEV